MPTIGSRIASFRAEKGLSRSELAALSGCTRNYIRSLEQWHERYRNPTIDKLYGIAAALEVHPFHLLDDIFTVRDGREGPRMDIKGYLKLSLGGRVRAIRLWRGLSISDLADKCSLLPEDIKSVERSGRIPFTRCYRIALELDVPLFWLLPDVLPKTATASAAPKNRVDHLLALFRELSLDEKQTVIMALINGGKKMGASTVKRTRRATPETKGR